MQDPMSDYSIADRLAILVWGPSGFRCDTCGHPDGYHLITRPRVYECKACAHQQSVVARTVMAASKVPLKVWYVRAQFYQRGVVPTCSQLARSADVARSTAWLVNHKFMAALACDRVQEPFDLTVLCRRPTRKPLGPLAPEELRAFWQALRRGEALAATVSVGQGTRVRPAVDHVPHPLGERIAHRLLRVHCTVCVRWLGRWVQHFVELWSRARSWLPCMLTHAPLPLVRLVPYDRWPAPSDRMHETA